MEGPPVRYPNLSADEVYRAGQSTLAESTPPLSPGQELPAYPVGGSLIYDDDELNAKEKAARAKARARARAKVRKTLLIRLLSSIFITVLVSLFVAAVVGRIENQQALKKKSHREAAILNTTIITITAVPDKIKQTTSTTTTMMMMTTTKTRHRVQTSFTATRSLTTTSTSLQSPTMTHAAITFDCPNAHFIMTATPTRRYGVPTKEATYEPAEHDDRGRRIVGVSVYPMDNCRVARATYKGLGNDIRYRCAFSCDEEGDDLMPFGLGP